MAAAGVGIVHAKAGGEKYPLAIVFRQCEFSISGVERMVHADHPRRVCCRVHGALELWAKRHDQQENTEEQRERKPCTFFHFNSLNYSERKAISGSTRVTRRAGT